MCVCVCARTEVVKTVLNLLSQAVDVCGVGHAVKSGVRIQNHIQLVLRLLCSAHPTPMQYYLFENLFPFMP